MKLYWTIRHPHSYGVLVAIWHNNTILLIRNSYLRYYSLPGGYIRRHESAQQAAVRELSEEIGLSIDIEILRPALEITHKWEGRQDHIKIFAIYLSELPKMKIDKREVIELNFFTPEEALKLDLFPPIRRHIKEHQIK